MKKCAACSAKARKLVFAMLLDGPGSMRRGKVCPKCASTGWLLVFAGEREAREHKDTVRRVAAKALGALSPEERKLVTSLATGGD